MKTTVRNALAASATLVQRLSHFANLDQMIDVDWYEDGTGFSIYDAPPSRSDVNHDMFRLIDTDTYINKDEILSFDYVDRKGERSSRVGVVVEPHKVSQRGKAGALIYDLDKDDGKVRWFSKDHMTNILYLRPV